MAGINLAGTNESLDVSLNTMITEFRLLDDEEAVCRKVSTHYDLKEGTGNSKNVLNYGRLSAYRIDQGVDITQAQSLSDAQTTYTPTEIALKVILSNLMLRRIADRGLFKRTGEMMRRAYNLKEDADGTAQFTSWTPIVGSAGTVIGLGHVTAARARVRIGNDRANPEPFPGKKHAVLHPLHCHALAMRAIPLTDVPTGTNVYAMTSAGATVGPGRGAKSDEILREGPKALMRIAGVDIWEDANIAVDASDDASGALFSQEGFVFTNELEPDLLPPEKDNSLRGQELVIVGSSIWGLYRPANSGVECLFDATLPTA